MKETFLVVMLSLLAACRSTEVLEYQGNNLLSARDAAAAVDRALMTQPPQYRPESIDVTNEYVMYGMGTISRGKNSLLIAPIGNTLAVGGGRSRSKSKALIERIYFDTLSNIKLIHKGRFFVVQVVTNDHQPKKTFFIYNEEQAHALIDGLQSLKNLAAQKSKPE